MRFAFNDCLAAALLTVTLTATATAAPIEDFKLPGLVYDGGVETPDEHFGHGLGDKPVRHDQLVSYLSGLAEVSDRISVETIGYTHERRPILLFTVTSPDNHAQIDQIRERHVASLSGGEIAEDAPSIIWMNYGVHGAESSGMDSIIPSLYHFAAAQGDEVEAILDRSVILMVGILNPDGHSRRIDHVQSFSGAVSVTDPSAEVHNLWTAARTNHYWFDLNRQWLLVSQPEAKAWVRAWQKWKPQVSTDFHEMGSQSTYYFHPGEPKRKNPLIPDEARVLTKNIAEFHRTFLDAEGQLYFTEEGFDNFYIGKGSTYPQANGGLGILFEAAAARGGAVESASGGRDYATNIRTHFRTTLSTIAGTLAQSEAIADYQRTFYRSAAEQADAAGVKAYVFTAGADRSRMMRFLELLDHHDIEVHRLARDIQVGDETYAASESYIVAMAQLQSTMIRGIFERKTSFEENIFYDVSGWTVPLAYDLTYAPLGAGLLRDGAAGRFDARLLGEVVGQGPTTRSRVPESQYGYVIPWEDRLAARAVYDLLSEDLLVRAAGEPFEVRTVDGVKNFSAGAIVVPLDRQKASSEMIHRTVRDVAQKYELAVHSLVSGAGDDATRSLGGRSFDPVEKPSILLLFDDGLARYDVGEVWHLLDFEMGMPVTLRRKGQLGGLDWSRYTHLILAGGRGNLPEEARKRVDQWIREESGTLIALRQSAYWAQQAFLSADEEASEPSVDSVKKRFDYDEKARRDAEHYVGGAIVATDIDTSHPLGFGLQDRVLPALRNTTDTLSWPENNPYAVVSAYPEEDLLLTGYMSEKRQGELAGAPAVIAEPLGRGHVVLISDNPVFRGYFLGTNRVLMNALFFSDMVDRPFGDYEEE